MIRSAVVVLFVATLPAMAAHPRDLPGSQDPEDLPRARGFYIGHYQQHAYDKMTVMAGKPGEAPTYIEKEGRVVEIVYIVDPEAQPKPTEDEVRKHYDALFAGLQTERKMDRPTYLSAVSERDGRERWFAFEGFEGYQYKVRAVEVGAMEELVTSTGMFQALEHEGRVALYLHFDTNKATLKPESKAVIDQIVTLLESNRALRLRVEGHTDSVGKPAANLKLSDARAKAVVTALTHRGISRARLKAQGFGQKRPIADNSTEDGRARNRRVELVNLDFKGKQVAEHPLFTRVPNFYVHEALVTDGGSEPFVVGRPGASTQVTKSGRHYRYDYWHADLGKAGARYPSPLQIARSFRNAVVRAGGTVEFESDRAMTFKLARDGAEVWAAVQSGQGDTYSLTIVEVARGGR